MYKHKAFTLAEVLITLGIIGIVAALTLPALIANYNKHLTITRLKRQYSLFKQAKMMIHPNINKIFTEGTSEEAVDFYKEFYAPYIRSTSIEPKDTGVLVGLNDGSGMLLWNRCRNNSSKTDFEYLIFCPRYKDCKDESINISIPETSVDGVKSFMLYAGGDSMMPAYLWTNGSREQLKELCRTIPGYCITLIAYDGWEIKDDYPHINKFRK